MKFVEPEVNVISFATERFAEPTSEDKSGTAEGGW